MILKLVRRTAVFLVPVALTACAVPFPVYTVSSSNVTSIRATKNTVELSEFTGSQTSVSCRLQPISPEGGRTFAQYIRNAFNDELVIAGQKPELAKSKLTLQLKNIDVDCAIGQASWMLEADVTVGSQKPFSIKTVRNFDGNLAGAIVVNRAYQAFVPSVQQLITDIMAHPSFRAEFGN